MKGVREKFGGSLWMLGNLNDVKWAVNDAG